MYKRQAEDNVGIDGWVNSYQETSNLQKELEKKQIHLTLAPDPFNELWTCLLYTSVRRINVIVQEFKDKVITSVSNREVFSEYLIQPVILTLFGRGIQL